MDGVTRMTGSWMTEVGCISGQGHIGKNDRGHMMDGLAKEIQNLRGYQHSVPVAGSGGATVEA